MKYLFGNNVHSLFTIDENLNIQTKILNVIDL